MRLPISAVLIAAAVPAAPTFAAPLVPVVTTLPVQAHPDVGNLECERSAPAPRRPATPNPDPLEVPDEEVVQEIVQAQAEAAPAPGGTTPAAAPLPGPAARIAIWGDSHLAAAFFSEELARQLKVPLDNVSNVLLPANMGRAGVRLPIRRSCVSPQWKYELGYLGGDHARTPGPGLVNLVTEQAGATLAWDVRTDKRVANYERVRILYQQTAAPTVVGISVDGAAETQVTLDRQPGPAVLELAADRPISQVKMRLIVGPMRLHGLDLQAQRASQLAMDVFGYPGATVAGWKTPQLDYLASWFGQRDYQLVMLEFGTNEGAARPFDSAAYRRTLEESVRNMRTVFPQAACVLIAPGDRGVLVPQSVNRGKRKGKGKAKAPKIVLYRYSRVHAEIGRVQREVGAAAGCATWSMLEAMGGMGAAYTWARQSPPLMARDLIHFTVPGYRRFAREFARDMGWTDADK
ncbi:GDSL-type esterase/lipase family protein [Pseudoduganella chitinolytica]|uniref:GDSL-type esterase/lipase family protein n=1 Tax=Pseudoduganella chitinolytica TaxID=34070 RepID=A0ABY8BEF3_9BURK|nr:GDSL-type esterase/lipase family protein [Pseudoduganella chitinolytica]WEF34291.1 GDSL-type esterase/lipase family protein [Pseudoduganella chitinolytica]